MTNAHRGRITLRTLSCQWLAPPPKGDYRSALAQPGSTRGCGFGPLTSAPLTAALASARMIPMASSHD